MGGVPVVRSARAQVRGGRAVTSGAEGTAAAVQGGRAQLRTRLVFGPLMLLAVGAIYLADSTLMAEAGHRGVLSAAIDDGKQQW